MTAFHDIANLFQHVGFIAAHAWFLVLPPLLWQAFKLMWREDFVQEQYLEKLKYVMLEVIPPRDIEKSPQPMESFFDTLAGVDKGLTIYEIYIKGELIPQFTFELVSDGGQIHFYVRCEKGFRNLVEASLYAHYPNIEIVDVPHDYVKDIPPGIPNKDWELWGADFSLSREGPYPIRTYKFFEEDVTGKMIDPLANILEVMGKVPPGHKLFFQVITSPVRPAQGYKENKKFVNDVIAKLIKEKSAALGEESSTVLEKLTPTEKRVMEALEDNIGKNMFQTRLRFVYLGPPTGFDKPTFVSGFIGSVKQFNDHNMNGFKPNDLSKTYANYVMSKTRKRYRQRRILRRYKKRQVTPVGTTCLMSTTELATVIHMPDMSVVAPMLARVSAKRGSAPVNLPV